MLPSATPRALPALVARMSQASHLLFLVFVALFIMTTPFIRTLPGGQLVDTALLTLVLVAGLLVMQTRRGLLVLATLLVVLGVIARWINYSQPESMPAVVHLGFGVLVLSLVAEESLRFILRAPRVTAQVLEAGIATYLVFGLVWTLAYMIVSHVNPAAFTFSVPGDSMDDSALYYSFVTLTTMGYGDIVPVSRVARMLAILEATTGVMYMSVLIARLVGLYATVTPIQDQNGPNPSSSDARD